MDYDTIITIERKNKQIVFFIKGEYLSLDTIIDVEVYDQPERSKREDFCLTELADAFIESWNENSMKFATHEEAYIKGVYDFSDWLKQKMRCSEH